MVREKIKATIEKYKLISTGDHVVIGLSGGPDSVCLFDVLISLSNEMGFALHAVHVNHMFRPGDAERDQRYVENLCRTNGLRCHSFVVDCNALAEELGMTSEEAGRKARYDAFYSVASQICADHGNARVRIAVAQNADDQAETILFRLLRGTGTDGLAGMTHERNERGFKVIRPLLDVYRDEIERYCAERELDPVIDDTNNKPVYTRNKIRLQLLPLLKEAYNENIKETLVRLGRIASSDKDCLWRMTESAYTDALTGRSCGSIAFDIGRIIDMHEAIRHRLVMRAFDTLGLSQDITEERLAALDRAIVSSRGKGNKAVEFPRGYTARIRYDSLILSSPDAAQGPEDNGQIQDEQHQLLCEVVSEKERVEDIKREIKEHGVSPDTAMFDYAKLRGSGDDDLELRTRREGDFIRLSGGRRKLRKLMIDMKIPADVRDDILLIARGKEILRIILTGVAGKMNTRHESNMQDRYAEVYKIDEDTTSILRVKIV